MSNSNVTWDQLKRSVQELTTTVQTLQTQIRQHRTLVSDLERKCHQQELDLITAAGRLDEARERQTIAEARLLQHGIYS